MRDDCYGLSGINSSITKHFLSLGDSYEKLLLTDQIEKDVLRSLNAFNLLCNMNARDNALAERELGLLDGTTLAERYPEIVLGLRYWAQGQKEKARQRLYIHLEQFRQDFIALFMLHMFDFLHGRPDLYGQYLIADARGDHPYFGSHFKGITAFSMCETSQAEAALPLAKEACSRHPLDDIYSIHALAHCWHALGMHRSVIDFLETNKNQWINNPGMNMHVHWHLAVSYLELGLINIAVENYRNFRTLMTCDHAEQDLDAVNFCVRIFFGKFPRPDFHNEYQILAKNWAPSIYNSLSYFNDIHAAFAFMMANERVLMQKLITRPCLFGTDAETAKVGKEILESIADFMDGNFSSCVERLQTTQPQWHRIGGSQPQREILSLLCTCAMAMTPSAQM